VQRKHYKKWSAWPINKNKLVLNLVSLGTKEP